jgi:hypothetical protein
MSSELENVIKDVISGGRCAYNVSTKRCRKTIGEKIEDVCDVAPSGRCIKKKASMKKSKKASKKSTSKKSKKSKSPPMSKLYFPKKFIVIAYFTNDDFMKKKRDGTEVISERYYEFLDKLMYEGDMKYQITYHTATVHMVDKNTIYIDMVITARRRKEVKQWLSSWPQYITHDISKETIVHRGPPKPLPVRASSRKM